MYMGHLSHPHWSNKGLACTQTRSQTFTLNYCSPVLACQVLSHHTHNAQETRQTSDQTSWPGDSLNHFHFWKKKKKLEKKIYPLTHAGKAISIYPVSSMKVFTQGCGRHFLKCPDLAAVVKALCFLLCIFLVMVCHIQVLWSRREGEYNRMGAMLNSSKS